MTVLDALRMVGRRPVSLDVRQDMSRESELHDNFLSIMVAKLRPGS